VARVRYASLSERDTSAQRWSISGQIDWREWDGEFVVRAHGSAITYLLSPLAGQVLKALRAGARQADDVARLVHTERMQSGSAAAATLAAAFAAPEADGPQVAAVLAELEALGVVRVDSA
jgi:hypothetical protein